MSFIKRMFKQDNKEVYKEIESYIYKDVLSAKDEALFKDLVLSNQETSIKVYKDIKHVHKEWIAMVLYEEGLGQELAELYIENTAKYREYLNCTANEIDELKLWLSNKTDTIPSNFCKSKFIPQLSYMPSKYLALMSKVSNYPERLAVYGLKNGYVDLVREPLKLMFVLFDKDYVDRYLENIKSYECVSDRDFQQMMSALFVSSHQSNAEKEYTLNLVHEFIKEDKEPYLNNIELMSKDIRVKIMNKLKGKGLIE